MSKDCKEDVIEAFFISRTVKLFVWLLFWGVLIWRVWTYTTPEAQPVTVALMIGSVMIPVFIAGAIIYWLMLYVIRGNLFNHDGTDNWKVMFGLLVSFIVLFAITQLLYKITIYQYLLPK
jgi:hypothetical protein